MPDATQDGNRLLAEANALFGEGKFKETAEAFSKIAVLLEGLEASGQFGRAMSLLNFDVADHNNLQAILTQPDDFLDKEAFTSLGETAEQLKEINLTCWYYRKALELDHDFASARERLSAEVEFSSVSLEAQRLRLRHPASKQARPVTRTSRAIKTNCSPKSIRGIRRCRNEPFRLAAFFG